MPLSDWNKTLADAKKILGSRAVIPENKMSVVQKNRADANKFVPEINTMREALEKKILQWQNVISKSRNSLDAADDEISDATYGLDPKKPDDKKKIDQAEALFTKFFKSVEQEYDDYAKYAAAIAKHVIQLNSYKNPQ